MKASIYNTLTIEVIKPVPTLQILKLVTILVRALYVIYQAGLYTR